MSTGVKSGVKVGTPTPEPAKMYVPGIKYPSIGEVGLPNFFHLTKYAGEASRSSP